MTRREGRGAIRLTTAVLCAAAGLALPGTAFSQEVAPASGDPLKPAEGDAETAYLRALYQEKELQDFAKAEAAYAAVAATANAPRRVVARALVARARCLLRLQRDADAKALLARVTQEFASEKEAADEAQRLSAPAAPAEDSASLADRIARSLFQGSPRDTVLPYGDRAVPVLTALIRGDQPRAALLAAEALVQIDTQLAHDAMRTLAASSSLPFPREFALPVAGYLPASDALPLLRSMPAAGARRAGYERLLQRGDGVTDAVCDAILADGEGRPPLAAIETFSTSGGARLALRALASGNAALRAEALEALREDSAKGNALASREVWFGAPAAALDDPAACDLLVERVYVRLGTWSGNLGASAALLRRIATQPAGARQILVYYSNPQQQAPAAAFDGETLRNAILATQDSALQTPLYPGFGRALDLARMTGADDLRFLAKHWPYPSDFAGLVLSGMPPGFALDDPTVGALLDPAHRSEVLASVCNWISQNAEGRTFVPAVSRAVAALVTHPTQTVRQAASWALGKLAVTRGALDPAIDPVPLVAEASSSTMPNSSSRWDAALMTVVRALPAASRARLVASLTPGDPAAATVAGLLDDVDDPAIDRKLEELIQSASSSSPANAAAQALLRRQREKAEPTFDRILRSGSKGGAAAVLSATLSGAGSTLPFDAAGRLVVTSFQVVPGTLNLPGAALTGVPARRLSTDFPVELRRELARAALSSKSEKDRRWGAQEEVSLRDESVWDLLLAVAEDADPEARNLARSALRSIDEGRREMEEFRSRSEMRKVREQIAVLLAAPETEQRKAGIAAIVAVGSRDWLGALVRIAAEDRDPAVRDAACAALVAMGSPASIQAADPAPEKK